MSNFFTRIKDFLTECLESYRLWLLQRLISYYWWCEEFLENIPSKKTGTKSHIFFDPLFTPAFFISLAISAASFGAQLLIQSLLTPRPKPQIRGKLTGEIGATDSIFGAPIPRIYGGRPSFDNFGGVEVGGNVIWLPQIREIRTTTQTGGGGGKGGTRSTSTTTITYKCDLAAAFGAGRLRLLRLKFNDETVFNISGGVTQNPEPTRYEAEAPENTLSGGAVVTTDAGCSGGEKVTAIGLGGKLTVNFSTDLSVIPIDPPEPTILVPYFEFTVRYKASGDLQAYIKLNGTGGIYSFPDSGGTVRTKTFIRQWTTGTHALEFSNPSAAAPEIDCVDVGVIFIEEPAGSGNRDELFPPEAEQDNILLPDPFDFDTNPLERYNARTEANEDGMMEFVLPGGANAVWYEGTETQPIDAVIAADLDTKHGNGSTPAFLGTTYLRVQNLDISKYGAVPQIRAVVENVDAQTVEEICLAEAELAGIESSDIDFSAGATKHIRGIYGTGQDAPEKFFEMCATIHNISFVESADGKIIIKDLSDNAPVATITQGDLGAFVADEQNAPPLDLIMTTVEDASEMIRNLELRYHNPRMPSDYGTDKASYSYPYTSSTRSESKSLNATLLPEEAMQIVRRDLQKYHLKAEPFAFSIPYKFCWVNAGDCVSVEVASGEFKTLRIEEKTGSAPGVYDCKATSEDIAILADVPFAAETGGIRPVPRAPVLPANSIGTIIDIPALVDAHERKTGVYAAVCKKPGFGKWNGAALYREKAGETARMVSLPDEAGMGVAVNALGSIPFGESANYFDTSSELIVDFYNFEPTSVDSLIAEEGANSFVVGEEVLVVEDWTRDNDYPNRWTGTNIHRIVKRTDGKDLTHVVGERVVFLNEAVKFVSLDAAEQNVERTWKFVTAGQLIEDAAPIEFTWAGENIYSKQVVTLSVTAIVPNAAKLVKADADASNIEIILPDAAAHREREITIKKIDATTKTVTISCFDTQTIDGASGLVISKPQDAYTLVSDGTNWVII